MRDEVKKFQVENNLAIVQNKPSVGKIILKIFLDFRKFIWNVNKNEIV